MEELYGKLLALLLILLLGGVSQRRLGLPASFYDSANTLVIHVRLEAVHRKSRDCA